MDFMRATEMPLPAGFGRAGVGDDRASGMLMNFKRGRCPIRVTTMCTQAGIKRCRRSSMGLQDPEFTARGVAPRAATARDSGQAAARVHADARSPGHSQIQGR